METTCATSGIVQKYSKDIICTIELKENLNECKITESSEINKGENFLGVVSAFTVQGVNNRGETVNHNLFIKVPPVDNNLRDYFPLNKLYKRECLVYTTLLPLFKKIQKEAGANNNENRIRFAHYIKADYEEYKEVLVLEDLSALDYKNFDRLKTLDYDHVILAISSIARFHALGFAVKHKNEKVFNEFKDMSFVLSDYGKEFGSVALYDTFVRMANLSPNPTVKQAIMNYIGDDVESKFLDYLDLDGKDDYPYKTLCHGDCWTNNFLFKYEEEKPVATIMLDFQMLRYGSPVTDLFYFLFTGTDQDFKDQHLEEVWNIYYDTFQGVLSEVGLDAEVLYPESVYRRHIREKYLLGLMYAMLLLPVTLSKREDAVDLGDMVGDDGSPKMDRISVSMECIERIEELVLDFLKRGIL